MPFCPNVGRPRSGAVRAGFSGDLAGARLRRGGVNGDCRAGSDPSNRLSKLQLLTTIVNDGGVRLRWPTGPNRHYVIECSPSITGAPWTVISPAVVGDGGMAEFLQTNALPAVRFYRVRVAD